MEMTDFQSFPDKNQSLHSNLAPEVFGDPEEVVYDPHLSTQEKRALLASWASDANAVPHLPSLRQLPNGSIVKVDDILRALKDLDARDDLASANGGHVSPWQRPFRRNQRLALKKWYRNGRGADDDDEPPPSPAYGLIRPKSGGGGAFAHPEPVAA
jgi:hypothetical protein